MNTEMERSRILEDARQTICRDRQDVHGSPESNFGLIADMWSALLGINLEAEDVAAMMVIFKVARAKTGQYHRDNFIDMVGYAALAGECAASNYIEDTCSPFEDIDTELRAEYHQRKEAALRQFFSGLDVDGN